MIEISNNLKSDTVTALPIKNHHCIICGKAFTIERAGKLYCTSKCRQAAYYHKDRIIAIRESQSLGINDDLLNISIKEYKKYLHYRDKIKEYKKMQFEFRNVEEGSETWQMLYNNPNSALTWERKAIPKRIFNLNIPYLSIEQWSFIKSLYPEMSPVDLIVLIYSLSSDFINQLNSEGSENSSKQNGKYNPIKNKYLHHLNKIVNGKVKFI